MRNFKLFGQLLTLCTGLLFFTGCQQDESVSPLNGSIEERNSSTTAYPNVLFYGLGPSNELYTYRSGPPATEVSSVMITGLRTEEFILAIDVRPATRGLYGVSNQSMIYTINGSTGVATAVSQTPFTPAIEGSTIGFDFNPMVDRMRLVTDKGQNLRIHPTTGQVVGVDLAINGPVVAVNSVAYSNNNAGASGTSLYDVDVLEGKLYRQNANAGSLVLVGSTGLTIVGEGGFDISRTGAALGVYLASGRPSFGSSGGIGGTSDDTTQEAYRLYSMNLRTGQATSLGKVRPMIGLAIQ